VLLDRVKLKLMHQEIKVQVSVISRWLKVLLKTSKMNSKINHSHHSAVSKWEDHLLIFKAMQLSQSHHSEDSRWDNKPKTIKPASKKMNKKEALHSETSKWLSNQSLKTNNSP